MSLDEFVKGNVKEKELEDEIEKKGMAPVGSLMFTEVRHKNGTAVVDLPAVDIIPQDV